MEKVPETLAAAKVLIEKLVENKKRGDEGKVFLFIDVDGAEAEVMLDTVLPTGVSVFDSGGVRVLPWGTTLLKIATSTQNFDFRAPVFGS